MATKTVTMYTDGACSGNPGPGGWGTILIYQGVEKELSGGAAQTTNNRMELMAVIAGLEGLKEPCAVQVYSDSKYVVDAMNLGWAARWQADGWKRNKKESAANVDLWQRLMGLCQRHQVSFHWIRGHDSNPHNERCDRLAVEESKKFSAPV